jgi:hypothetical protein
MVLLDIVIEHGEVDYEVATDHGSEAAEDRDDDEDGSIDWGYVFHAKWCQHR